MKQQQPDFLESCCSTPEVPYLIFENRLRASGFSHIAGCDEAGRGPFAGPVVAAACLITKKDRLEYVKDSKALSPEERDDAFSRLLLDPEVFWDYHVIDAPQIDEMNILRATLLAMKCSIDKLQKNTNVDFVLIDGRDSPPLEVAHQTVVKGDSLSQSIAAASIVAKVIRDRIMLEFDKQYPEYGFKDHKGYGTKKHIAAIQKYGLLPIHRRSFCHMPVAAEADVFQIGV